MSFRCWKEYRIKKFLSWWNYTSLIHLVILFHWSFIFVSLIKSNCTKIFDSRIHSTNFFCEISNAAVNCRLSFRENWWSLYCGEKGDANKVIGFGSPFTLSPSLLISLCYEMLPNLRQYRVHIELDILISKPFKLNLNVSLIKEKLQKLWVYENIWVKCLTAWHTRKSSCISIA